MGSTGDVNRQAGKAATVVLLKSWRWDGMLDLGEQREEKICRWCLREWEPGVNWWVGRRRLAWDGLWDPQEMWAGGRVGGCNWCSVAPTDWSRGLYLGEEGVFSWLISLLSLCVPSEYLPVLGPRMMGWGDEVRKGRFREKVFVKHWGWGQRGKQKPRRFFCYWVVIRLRRLDLKEQKDSVSTISLLGLEAKTQQGVGELRLKGKDLVHPKITH